MDTMQHVPQLQNENESEYDSVSRSGSEGSVTETTHEQELFKKAVKEWILLDDQNSEMRKEINVRNKRKKELSQLIVTYMGKVQKDVCNLGNSGSLEVKQRKSTTALKKDYVEELLKNFLKDETKAKESAEYIFNNKQVKFVPTLKRNIKK